VGGGIFSIKTRRKENAIVLEFSDNGPGARELDKVFDPFYTTRAVGQGPGLGLSACFGIIQEHEGVILCTNRVEGGTTISIELPAAGTRSLVAAKDMLGKVPSPALEPAIVDPRLGS
jgi:two-component system NtrC family sensor kinase